MKARYIVGMICVIIGLGLAGQSWAADWVHYLSADTGEKYYDKSSIKVVNKKLVRVWTKTVLNENGKAEKFLFLKTIDAAPVNADIISYNLMLEEIDCIDEKYRSSSQMVYDKNNAIIAATPKKISEWNDIVPGSISDKLKNLVCTANKISKPPK